LLSCILYYGSYLATTYKYNVQYTSGVCDISRTVNHEWQRKIYYPASVIEMKLFGKKENKQTLRINTLELQKYYNEQEKLCKTLE